MKHGAQRPVAYLLKRYPRLSETFILNEMRALERLGARLQVFSLLRPEEALIHDAAAELRAPVTYFPATWPQKLWLGAKAHATMVLSEPKRYLHAVGLTFWWCMRSRRPVSVWKQFFRSAYIAVHCRQQGVRHLHAHFANAPATVARLVSVMCDVPHSFTTHAKDLYLTRKETLRRRIKRAAFVLTCTRYNLDYLRSFVPHEDWNKMHLIYHGIDLTSFPFKRCWRTKSSAEASSLAADGLPLVLCVARLVPKKGLKDVISAGAILRLRGVSFRCAIVGEGPLRADLSRQIERLGLGEVVSLLGAMPHDRLIPIYQQASVFALSPQITEDGDRDGIPNVIAEAMAAGVPVVSSRVSGIPELVEHGKTGLLVESGDATALADAIERLLRDPAECRELAVAARRKIETSFECWETAKTLHALLAAA
jgi:glycosyltransferase involved in cell wall biosynthesis